MATSPPFRAVPPAGAARRRFALLALLLAGAGSAMAPAVCAAQTLSLTPIADGWVRSSAPRSSDGGGARLRVSRSPRLVSFIEFSLSGVSATPRDVTLRVRAIGASDGSGLDVHTAHTRRWSATRLRPAHAPTVGGVLGHRRRYASGWISFDVSRFVRGNGTYTFALTTKGHRSLRFFGRRTGSRRAPRLIVDLANSTGGGPGGGGPGGGSGGLSTTRPPGSAILSDSAAAALVRSEPEIHPGNSTPNHTVPTAAQIADFHAASSEPYSDQVTGDFTGSTDEIIQWAAWKWGIDEDVMRAVAVQESDWDQNGVYDNGVSFGIFSLKTNLAKGGNGWDGTYPLAQDSTAFNADFYGRSFRSCYDGRETYLHNGYGPGDQWGCVGFWFSGDWHDSGAEDYVSQVQSALADRTWTQPGF